MNLNKIAIAVCLSAFFTPLSFAKNLVDYLDTQEQIENHATSINSLYELLQFQQGMRYNSKKLLSVIERQNHEYAMSEYAYNLAIRTAIISQLSKAHHQIKANARQLDAIYNFEPLMIQGRVVPPVITEARNLYNQNTPHQIRLSGAVYDIYAQARFSSTAPNWRDYLVFPNEKDAYELLGFGATGFEPKNDRERQVWVSATKKGWQAGIEQANATIRLAMDRLNRDYIGMVRFHTFVAQGKITMPIISTYQLYNTNAGERLIIDEQLLQIQTLPSFNTPKENVMRQVQGALNYTVGDGQIKLEPISSATSAPPDASQVIENQLQGKSITKEPFSNEVTAHTKAFYEKPLSITIDRHYIIDEPKVKEGGTVLDDGFIGEVKAVHDTLGEPVKQENPEAGINRTIEPKITPRVIHHLTDKANVTIGDRESPYWETYKE